jgi:hypothetical protein
MEMNTLIGGGFIPSFQGAGHRGVYSEKHSPAHPLYVGDCFKSGHSSAQPVSPLCADIVAKVFLRC